MLIALSTLTSLNRSLRSLESTSNLVGISLLRALLTQTSHPPNYLLYGNFTDIIPNKCQIENFSGYHSVEKPTQKLLEQISDVIRLKHYFYEPNQILFMG
jgi:hypothetical protein